MGKTALVLFANGFEEIEALTPVDVLRRAGVRVVTAGIGGTEITAAHGVAVRTDATLEAALKEEYDLVVLPGGMPGAKNIAGASPARDRAEKMLAGGKLVAAICAAPAVALASWGCLKGKRATCYPGMETAFPKDAVFSPDRVVVDGNLTTSRGPGTAMQFALSLAAQLCGAEVSEKLRHDMLVKNEA